MSQNNNILNIATHPQYGTDIVIYEESWTHALDGHYELEDCEGPNHCLEEVIETLNNPDAILEGRKPETEELFVRYTEQTGETEFTGYSVSTRTEDDITFMTTAYHDVVKPWNKGNVKWTKNKGAVNE